MDESLRDRRILVALMTWGDLVERSANAAAKDITGYGLNVRDTIVLGTVHFDWEGSVLPSQLVGSAHATSAGVTGSLHRLEKAGLIRRSVDETDARQRPVHITEVGAGVVMSIVGPWDDWIDSHLSNLDSDERTQIYGLLMKAAGLWDDAWPAL